MAVRRTRLAFETNFTRIPNEWLRDRRLSRRARGLLAELMTHQVGWEITTESLIEAGTEGRDAVLKTLAELEAYGYLTRHKYREGGKFKGTDYTITDPAEVPAAEESPRPENPVTVNPLSPRPEKPPLAKPPLANPHQRRTSSLEDHSPLEDHGVNADAFTRGETLNAEPLPMEMPAPAVAVAKAQDPATPEEWVAKQAYDQTSGALPFMGMKAIAKWAIHTKGAHPRNVLNAIEELYTGGRQPTKTSVAQKLDGIIDKHGRTNRPEVDRTVEKMNHTMAMRLPGTAAPDAAHAITSDPFLEALRITS